MRKLRTAALALLLAMVSACGSSSTEATPIATPAGDTTNAPSYSDSVLLYGEGMRAKVIAATANDECTPAIEPGDCWLPAYAGEENSPNTPVLNLGGNCTSTTQESCWPQPPGNVNSEGDTVIVVCKTYDDRQQLRFGFFVPLDRIPDEELRRLGQAISVNDAVGRVGQNYARYLEFVDAPKGSTEEGAIIDQLPRCTSP